MITIKQIKRALVIYYSAPAEKAFKQFRDGGIYFSVGLMAALMANFYMEASWQQELLFLAGLVLGGIGFFMAIMAEIRLVIGRFVRFYSKK